MAWPLLLSRWFRHSSSPRTAAAADTVGDSLRAAVREHTRVKADSTRCYEARMQTMIDDLFLRMGEHHARRDA